MPRSHFKPCIFAFLKDLKANNNREWFQANKKRYEEDLKAPSLEFIVDFAPYLEAISPHFRADPRPVGGSLFRIYRDVRFSKDKSPYKTHAGIHFRHKAGKTAHTPGFYLHLEPGGCFVGIGLWRPDGPTLKMIRDRVAEKPDSWRSAVENTAFAKSFTIDGERLKRPPKGYDPDHDLVEVLKMKDFTAIRHLTQAEVTKKAFIDEFASLCESGGSLVEFICAAVEQPY